MAICAKEFKKPFYVLTESYKFSRMYPLNQKDLPNNFKVSNIFKTLCGRIDN
jgi:translation initiation factor eIF-2B subunit alpha